MILYADILFLMDFSMDVLTLWSAGRLTHSPLRLGRLCLAAGCSALASVVATVLCLNRPTSFALCTALPALMCLIAFGRARMSVFLRRYLLLWLGGLLLGGCITLLFQRGSVARYESTHTVGNPAVLLFAGAFVAMLLVKILSRTPSARFCKIILRFRHRALSLRGLCDSGNLLTDPFTGIPVVIIKADSVRELFATDEYVFLASGGNIPASLAGSVRFIPAKGVSGEILLRAIRPERITVNGTEYRALIALSNELSATDCDAVLPSSLF